MFCTHHALGRGLCWLLTGLMVFAPELHVFAQEGTSGDAIDTTYLLPKSCVVVSLRPQAILNSQALAMMPIEVLQAASLQQVGVDPLELRRVLFSCEAPAAGLPRYALHADFVTPVAGKLNPRITRGLQLQSGSARPHYQAAQPMAPSLYFPQDHSVLATPETTLQGFLSGAMQPMQEGLLPDLSSAAQDDLYVGIDFVPLCPLVNMMLMQQDLPPELQHLLTAPNLIKKITLRVNLSHPGTNELVVEANSPADAETLQGLVQQTIDTYRAEVKKTVDELNRNPNPVVQAFGRYQERIAKAMSEGLLPQREDSRLIVFRQEFEGETGEQAALTSVAVFGILVSLLLPAVQAAREAARQNTSMRHLKMLALALLNHEAAFGEFPAHASYVANGKPLLSWRVHILPFLERQALYDQFHLDEPWDSDHNRALISKMPVVFLDPSSKLVTDSGRTHYLGVQGKGFFFSGTDQGTKIRSISDGTSRTVMLVQVTVTRAAVWTKPDDWEFNEKKPLAGLVPTLHPTIFYVSFADGSVRAVAADVDPDSFKASLTIAGGEAAPAP